MGCVYSGPGRPLFRRSLRSSETSPAATGENAHRVFRVANVDDRGTEINYGDIEVTNTDIMLHQRDRNPICWPLRSLRRYGFDSELFSFECGRRCPTGPGIYAFRCAQAEQLFNVLQEAIQMCSSNNIAATGGTLPTATTGSNPGSPVQNNANVEISGTNQRRDSRISSPPHNYANDVHPYINSPFYVNTNTVSTSLPPATAVASQSLPTTGVTDINTNYAKLDDLVNYYVNIMTPATSSSTTANASSQETKSSNATSIVENHPSEATSTTVSSQDNSTSERKDPDEPRPSSPIPPTLTPDNHLQQVTKPALPPTISTLAPPPRTPTGDEPMNYIMLDLDTSTSSNTAGGAHFVTTAPATPVSKTPKNGENSWTPPGTPTSLTSLPGQQLPKQSYVTIDFDKTIALSSAANHRKCV